MFNVWGNYTMRVCHCRIGRDFANQYLKEIGGLFLFFFFFLQSLISTLKINYKEHGLLL